MMDVGPGSRPSQCRIRRLSSASSVDHFLEHYTTAFNGFAAADSLAHVLP